jgi:multimeric flavodoxin WrbA
MTLGTQVTILGISGSPRSGNTEILVREALAGAAAVSGIQTQFYSFDRREFHPCAARCWKYCAKHGNCCYEDDFQGFYARWLAADGILFGVPVYHMSVPAQVKAAIDRLGNVLAAHYGDDLPRFSKVCAALTQGMDAFGGQELTLQFLVAHFVLMNCIAISGDLLGSYIGAAGIAPGIELDAIQGNQRTLSIARNVGQRVAEMSRVVRAGMDVLEDDLPDQYRFRQDALAKAGTIPGSTRPCEHSDEGEEIDP